MKEYTKELRVGRKCPNFKGMTSNGPIDFHFWSRGKWTLLFLKPCAIQVSHSVEEYIPKILQKLNQLEINLIAFSNGDDDNKYWGNEPTRTKIPLSFPIIFDINDMLRSKFSHGFNKSNNNALNRVYILNPKNEVMQIVTYRKEVAIDLNDFIMVIQSLQTTAFHQLIRY